MVVPESVSAKGEVAPMVTAPAPLSQMPASVWLVDTSVGWKPYAALVNCATAVPPVGGPTGVQLLPAPQSELTFPHVNTVAAADAADAEQSTAATARAPTMRAIQLDRLLTVPLENKHSTDKCRDDMAILYG